MLMFIITNRMALLSFGLRCEPLSPSRPVMNVCVRPTDLTTPETRAKRFCHYSGDRKFNQPRQNEICEHDGQLQTLHLLFVVEQVTLS